MKNMYIRIHYTVTRPVFSVVLVSSNFLTVPRSFYLRSNLHLIAIFGFFAIQIFFKILNSRMRAYYTTITWVTSLYSTKQRNKWKISISDLNSPRKINKNFHGYIVDIKLGNKNEPGIRVSVWIIVSVGLMYSVGTSIPNYQTGIWTPEPWGLLDCQFIITMNYGNFWGTAILDNGQCASDARLTVTRSTWT